MTVDLRSKAIRFGGPLVVPAPEVDDRWQIKGVDGSEGVPCGVLVISGAELGHLTLRTTTRHMDDQKLDEAIDVRDAIHAGLPWSGIELPLTVTVTKREVEIPVDGTPVRFLLYESGTGWNMRTELGDRILQVSGEDGFRDDLACSTVADIEALPDHRFPSTSPTGE